MTEYSIPVAEDLDLDGIGFSLAFHPKNPLLVCGDLSGGVKVLEYPTPQNLTAACGGELPTTKLGEEVFHCKACSSFTTNANEDAVAALKFDDAGKNLFAAGRYLRVIDVEAQSILLDISKLSSLGHNEDGISTLGMIGDQTFLTAGNGGAVNLWDIRAGCSTWEGVASCSLHDGEPISAMCIDVAREKHTVFTAGDDGRVGMIDLRKFSEPTMTDGWDEPLKDVALMDRGKSIVATSEEGTLGLWHWGKVEGQPYDKCKLKTEVDMALKVTEADIILGAKESLQHIQLWPRAKWKGLVKESEDAGTILGLQASPILPGLLAWLTDGTEGCGKILFADASDIMGGRTCDTGGKDLLPCDDGEAASDGEEGGWETDTSSDDGEGEEGEEEDEDSSDGDSDDFSKKPRKGDRKKLMRIDLGRWRREKFFSGL